MDRGQVDVDTRSAYLQSLQSASLNLHEQVYGAGAGSRQSRSEARPVHAGRACNQGYDYGAIAEQIWNLNGDQKDQLCAAVSKTLANVASDQGAQISRGAVKGAENFAHGCVQTAEVVFSAPVNAGAYVYDACRNPERARADMVRIGSQAQDFAARASGDAWHYADGVARGDRNICDDFAASAQELSNHAAAAWSRFDQLPTEKKAEVGTEAVLTYVPIAEGAQLLGWLGKGARVAAKAETVATATVRGAETSSAARAAELDAHFEELFAKWDDGVKKAAPESQARDAATLAGKGGDWPVLNERYSADVVKQINDVSCVSACGEMLSEGRLKQADLIEKIGSPADIADLKSELGAGWNAGWVSPQQIGKLLDQAPFGAELRDATVARHRIDLGHVVVVDGLDGKGDVMIRDPKHGTRYEMTVDNFKHSWSGMTVFCLRR